MPVGPKGEKRPVSTTSNAIHVMKIATGLAKEEYVDGRPWTDDEVMAMRDKRMAIHKVKKTKKRKKTKQ